MSYGMKGICALVCSLVVWPSSLSAVGIQHLSLGEDVMIGEGRADAVSVETPFRRSFSSSGSPDCVMPAMWDFEYTAPGGEIANDTVQWFPLFICADETGVVNLELEIAGLTHGSPMDLNVYLLDPAGGGIGVMDERNDQTPINNVTLVFSDEAGSLPPANTELLPGTYLPEGPGMFSQYYPSIGADEWSLVVMDDGPGETGTFESFALRGGGFPEPATLSLLVLGGLAMLRRRDTSEKPVRLPRLLPMSFLCCLLLLAVPAAHANLIGVDFESGRLYEVSTADASLSLIGNTGLVHLGSLEQGPGGFLYGVTAGRAPVLYKIDPSTAAATEIGPLGIGFVFEGSLAFAADGTAYGTNQGTSANCGLFEVDVSSGAATPIGTLTGGAHDIDGLAWRSDGKLVGLDRETNALLEIDPSNAHVNVIAALGPVVGEVGGMAVLDDVAYFATGGPTAWPVGSNELYSVDLFTGAHPLVGSFSPTITGVGVSGLAVPTSSTLLLMVVGSLLVLIQRRR